MKTYTTSQAQNFSVDYASSLPSGFGHRKINVYIMSEDGDKKEFGAKTSNMSGFDESTDLEGQEKYEALFELVESSLDGEISEWLYEIKEGDQ